MRFEVPSTLFDSQKAAQAVAVMLREQTNQQTGRRRLLKLLYLAERESLQEAGQMITWDHVFAMKFGPVLSEVYDLIKKKHDDSSSWDGFIERYPIEVKLVGNPGLGLLSDFEIEKLQQVATKFASYEDSALVEYCHKHCPEWKDPGSTSTPILLRDILREVGMGDHADEIISEAKQAAHAKNHAFQMEPF